jgi:hypothetical protein
LLGQPASRDRETADFFGMTALLAGVIGRSLEATHIYEANSTALIAILRQRPEAIICNSDFCRATQTDHVDRRSAGQGLYVLSFSRLISCAKRYIVVPSSNRAKYMCLPILNISRNTIGRSSK